LRARRPPLRGSNLLTLRA